MHAPLPSKEPLNYNTSNDKMECNSCTGDYLYSIAFKLDMLVI